MAKIKGKWIEDSTITESKLDINNAPTDTYVLTWNDSASKPEWSVPSSSDAHDVKVSANDTTTGFLNGKLVAGTNIILTENDNGANETLTIETGSDVFLKSVDDTDDLTEGSSNLFYSDSLVNTNLTTNWIGQASGIAPLNASSKIDSSYLPAIALTDVNVVADEASQLLLTAEEGDVAVRTDLNKSYVHNGGTAGTMADWTELLTPTDAVTSVNSQTGIVVLDTDDVSEGSTNKYYNDSLVDTHLSGGTGITYSSGVISLTDTTTIETKKVEIITLTSTNITNKYVDLSNIPLDNTSVEVNPVGATEQQYTTDFTVISDGSDVKRLNWSGLGLDGVLEENDVLIVSYTY